MFNRKRQFPNNNRNKYPFKRGRPNDNFEPQQGQTWQAQRFNRNNGIQPGADSRRMQNQMSQYCHNRNRTYKDPTRQDHDQGGSQEMPNQKNKQRIFHTNRNEPYIEPESEKQKYEIIGRVRSQKGIKSQLVLFYSSGDLPYTILHNAVDRINGLLNITKLDSTFDKIDNTYKFRLSINNETLAEGPFRSETMAKKSLAEEAIESLKKTCFTIFRKIQARDTPQVNLPSSAESKNQLQKNLKSSGGIGAKMMLQMGWSGKGLGVQEQGRMDIIQPYMQIQRQGFGTKNIVGEVRSILETYAASKDINSIAFTPEFTKEERAVIHNVARKLNLISRSYGSAADRMLVVRSKIKSWDLIYSLLEAGGETEQLKLILPKDFE